MDNSIEARTKRLSCRALREDDHLVKSGLVMKRHRDYFFKCLDRPVQRMLILKGSFLLRYKVDKDGEARGSPTGLPIEITQNSFNPCSNDETSFEIFNVVGSYEGKTYVYQCQSKQECDEWLEALQLVKDRTLKQKLNIVNVAESDMITNKQARKKVNEFIIEKKYEEEEQVTRSKLILARGGLTA